MVGLFVGWVSVVGVGRFVRLSGCGLGWYRVGEEEVIPKRSSACFTMKGYLTHRAVLPL